MILICAINIVINVSGVNFLTQADVEGKKINSSKDMYLVDFSEGVQKFDLAGQPSDYSRILVDKNKCVAIK